MTKQLIIWCGILLTGVPSPTLAQWPILIKNELNLEAGGSYFSADRKFDNDGQKKEIPELSELSLYFDIQYGISSSLTLGFYAPYWVKNELSVTEPGGESFKFTNQAGGDTELSLHYRLLPDSIWPLALSFHQGLGMADADDQYGLQTGYDDFYQYIALHTRVLSPSRHWHFLAEGGYHNHTNGFPDEIKAMLSMQYFFHSSSFARLIFKGIQPLSENDVRDENPWGLYSRESGKLSIDAKAEIRLSERLQLGMNAEFYLKGQHLHEGPLYQISLRYRSIKSEGRN